MQNIEESILGMKRGIVKLESICIEPHRYKKRDLHYWVFESAHIGLDPRLQKFNAKKNK